MEKKWLLHGVRLFTLASLLVVSACAGVDVPGTRNVNIPSPALADSRKTAINERPDSVMYLPLGRDVLIPEVHEDDKFPAEKVGPFEMRGETVAGALQLVLSDYDISIAFETDLGLTRRITVSNMHGSVEKVVHQICSLANLYCSFQDGTVTVKETQTFTVTLPPLGTGDEATFLDDVVEGLTAIVGEDVPEPIADPTTRTIVYSATQRTADIASRYFQRLRANTAMIVFETYIWEVALNSGNSTGVNWEAIDSFGKFNTTVALDGAVGADFTNPISIGLPTTQDIGATPSDIVEFLSQFGAVKTISQPQITVLSGSEAELRVADTENYVSQITTTLDEGQASTAVNTDSVDTGFTLTIGSSWDKATVYANVEIELTNVSEIEPFTFSDGGTDGADTVIQLPKTSERQLTTQIRVRPGDSVLIAGLVRENDNFNADGIGLMKPVLPTSRTAQTENLELVILMRPRVIVYTPADDQRYLDYNQKKHTKAEQLPSGQISSVLGRQQPPLSNEAVTKPDALIQPPREYGSESPKTIVPVSKEPIALLPQVKTKTPEPVAPSPARSSIIEDLKLSAPPYPSKPTSASKNIEHKSALLPPIEAVNLTRSSIVTPQGADQAKNPKSIVAAPGVKSMANPASKASASAPVVPAPSEPVKVEPPSLYETYEYYTP